MKTKPIGIIKVTNRGPVNSQVGSGLNSQGQPKAGARQPVAAIPSWKKK